MRSPGPLLLLLVSLLGFGPQTHAVIPSLLGDIDGDGQPTVLDLVRLINHINGAATIPTGPNVLPGSLVPYADVNEDGAINQRDVDLIAEAILGLRPLPNPYSAPTVSVPVAATNGSMILITGVSGPHRQILTTGGRFAVFTSSDSNGLFTVTVELRPNQLNNLFVIATGGLGSGAPTPLRIFQDSQPPNLFVDFPTNGQTLFTSTTVIAGRVGDALSGFMGLEVLVHSSPAEGAPPPAGERAGSRANTNVGIGNNGSFERSFVPLTEGTNIITVAATDAHGNTTRKSITINRQPLAGNQPRLVLVSGDLQATNVHRRLAQPIVVKAVQSDGVTPFANKLVTLEVTRSDGRLLPVDGSAVASPAAFANDITRTVHGALRLQLFTDGNGQARAWWALGGDAGCGNNRVQASSAGLSNTLFFCASARPAVASQINVGTGNSQKAETGAFVAEPLRAWVNDTCNGIQGMPVTFTILRGSGRLYGAGALGTALPGSSPTSITVTSSITGHAEALVQLGSDAGQNSIQATFPGNPGLAASFIAYGVARDPAQPTRLSGLVLDNTSGPIGGAACSVSVGGQMFFAATDTQGRFQFPSSLPAGPAQLRVVGSTATLLRGALIPADSFPSLEFSLTLIPNAQNSLPSPVLLPRLNPNNQRLYYGTNDLVLTCEGMAGLKMTILANSMSDPSGSRITPQNPAYVSLNQVHHDDVPMPIPDGASPPFAWTLQPGGATFDPPVTIEYPNMSGLPAGAAAYFLSFNHETRRFEIVASGHVLADSARIMTDPGAGLSVAGWGCNCPPYAATCDVENCPEPSASLARFSPPPPAGCCPIELTGPTVLSTNGSITITATGGDVTWEVDQPGAQVTFSSTPTSIELQGKKASQNLDDVVVRATSIDDPSCVIEHRVTAVAAFFKETAPCCAFDDTVDPPWLMVPLGDDNTAQLEVTPPAAASKVELESSSTALATVSPTTVGASPQAVTVTGVAEGEPEVRAKLMETGEMLAVLKIAVKKQQVKLLVIHAITEANQNLAPMNVPSDLALEDYLNQIWGKQANVYFVVIRTDFTVAYDLDANGICDRPVEGQFGPEEVEILLHAADLGADFNLFYVASYSVAGTLANASTSPPSPGIGPQTFIQDNHDNSALNITAHEMGHALGLIGYESGDMKDVMYVNSLKKNPCRVTKHDWDIVNK